MIEPAEALGPDAEYLARARNRMAFIDVQTPEVRALIHEFGLTVVKTFLDLEIRKPNHIRHLIERIREGSEQYGNGSRGERRSEYILADLKRWLPNLVAVPREPSDEMIRASMEAVTPLGQPGAVALTKWEKHRVRLREALGIELRKRTAP